MASKVAPVRVRVVVLGVALAVAVSGPAVVRASGPTNVAGVPSADVGVHGPIADFLGGSQPLQLVGHTDLSSAQTGGKALGNNGGIALIDHCAFVGRWHDYGDPNAATPTPQFPIQIVDVADPSNPTVIGSVPGSTVHDAVAREIRAIDLPTFKLLTVQTFGKYLDEGADTLGENGLYFYTFQNNDCTKPVLAGSFASSALRPHEFFQWLDPNPAHNVAGHPRILEYVTTPLSGLDGYVVDASNPANPSLIGVWHGLQPGVSATEENLQPPVPAGYGRYTHSISISPDGTRAYVSQWDGGFYTLDTSLFARALPAGTLRPLGAASIPLLAFNKPGNTHSAVAVPGTNDLVVGSEIYVTTDGCPFGWMRVVQGGTLTQPAKVLSQFKLAENNAASCAGKLTGDRNANGARLDGTFTMHNQTVTRHYVLTSWYGAGLRVIDISHPAHPAQVAFFVPKPVADPLASIPDTPAPIYGATPSTADDWWVSTWSYPIIRRGLIYVADVRNGLFILRATPGPLATELSGITFDEGNSDLGSFLHG